MEVVINCARGGAVKRGCEESCGEVRSAANVIKKGDEGKEDLVISDRDGGGGGSGGGNGVVVYYNDREQ